MQLSQNPSTPILKTLAKKISKLSISKLLSDSNRVTELNYEIGEIKVDLSRQLLTTSVLSQLIKMANCAEINIKINELMDGIYLNKSENRPITHFNLRNTSRKNTASWLKLKAFVKKIRNNREILDVVNIGIGGSHLGSKTVESALKYYCDGPNIHFASSVDPSSMSDILNNCQPKNTIFIINSKSFKTTEVLNNARLVWQWLKKNNQEEKEFIYAVTASKPAATTWCQRR
jgi:glucose-6-phosphate isomerase